MAVTQPKHPDIPTVEQVMREFSRDQALELFKTLPAPDPEELNGEYAGQVHDGGDLALRRAKEAFFFDETSEFGYWLGKTYVSRPDGTGEGYNNWRRPGGAVERYLRFGTEIGPSHFDGNPSVIMYYRAFDNYMGNIDLIDEIRRLDNGVYLGIYSATRGLPGFSIMQPGAERSEIDVFALTGPIGPWIGVDDPELELR